MVNEKKLVFEAISINGNVGYVSDYNQNSLFKVDINTGECQFLRFFEDEPMKIKRLHCSALQIDNKIYFIPGSGNKISVFYPENNIIDSIEIPVPKTGQYSFYKVQYKFVSAVKYRNSLWLVPATYPGVIKLNLCTNEIEVFNNWIENDEYMFRMGLCVEEDRFLIANGKSNAVLVFDMKNELGKIVYIGDKNFGNMGMVKIENEYWFAPRLPGAIISWNPKSRVVKEYDTYPKEFVGGNIVFSRIYAYGDKIVFPPAQANVGLIYTNGKIEIDKDVVWKINSQSNVEYLFESEEYMFFREITKGQSDRCMKISKSDNSLSEYSFFFLDDKIREKNMLKLSLLKKEMILENENIKLNDYINEII